MVETWVLWLFVVGLVIGIVVTLVVVVRLPRGEVDVTDQERPTEAAWISGIIERHGGIAPVLLVEEVLDLHQAYLQEPRPPVPPRDGPGAPVLTPAAGQGAWDGQGAPVGQDAWAGQGTWVGSPPYPAPPGPPPAGYPPIPPGAPPASTATTPPRPR
jgi:hypothetical protein